MKHARFSLLLILFVLAAPIAVAQSTGRIEGRVTGDDGRGHGGITVVIHETRQATLTDSSGHYAFSGVAPGNYTLVFTHVADTQTEEGVVVTAGSTASVDITAGWELTFAESITVYSASRRTERIVEAPAAVTIVSQEEIEQQASHGQLPKLLEFTPGAEVTQSGLYDYNVNTRGFNSSLNRRVATLIDGRDPSVPFLGAQEWAAISFPLDDLASLEMVRGPSAALYGANASSGVLNMTTKQPRYSQGGVVRFTGGELDTTHLDLRWAGEVGNDWYLKAVGGVHNSGDFSVSRNGAAEYSVPCMAPGQTDCLPQEAPLTRVDDDEISFVGVRVDKYLHDGSAITVEGGWADIAGPVFQTGIGRVQLVDVQRPWARVNYNRDHWNVLAYYNKRDAAKQTALSTGGNLVLDTDNIHIEGQTHWDFFDDKVRFVGGASYEQENLDSLDPATGRQTLMFEPVDSDTTALFAQGDWKINDKFKLVVAGRLDDSSLHDSQFSPKGSLVYSFADSQALRLTYNEAFQVANYSEFFLQADVAAPVDLSAVEGICTLEGVDCGFGNGATRVLALGNESLDLEEIRTIELGYTAIFGGHTFLTLEYYSSEQESFITDLTPQCGTALGTCATPEDRVNPNFGPYTPPAALSAPSQAVLLATLQGALGAQFAILSNNLDGSPLFAAVSYTNFGKVDTQGADLGINRYFGDGWVLSLAYSWFDFEIKDSAPGLDQILLPNTPETKGSVGVQYNGKRIDFGISGRWSDEFRWVVGPFQGEVEAYVTMDLTANFRVNEHWAVGINAANILDDEHWESFGGDVLGRRALGSVTFSW